ncbi:MAG: CDP-alcohol phosphatidyltransferase family protein [Rhodospirillales bacterium]|jgi:phosphatidylglycerophosphate synthase
MTKKQFLPYDQKLARIMVRPLVGTSVRPNHITGLTLLMTIMAGVLFAEGNPVSANWAAGLFVLARFLDHFDGELARLQSTSSSFGYYFDYVVGGIGYAALFAGLGIGHMGSELGNWSLVLGGAGAASALISLFSNLGIDQRMENLGDGESIGYPGFAGFELEDGIYLLAPVTWLSFLMPFFIAAGIGAMIYCLWTIGSYIKLGAQKSPEFQKEETRKK